jgi:hypothetical protein
LPSAFDFVRQRYRRVYFPVHAGPGQKHHDAEQEQERQAREYQDSLDWIRRPIDDDDQPDWF